MEVIMKKKKENSSIKCDVKSCEHNNCNMNCCMLDEIKVSCCCNSEDVNNKDETICSSYKKAE